MLAVSGSTVLKVLQVIQYTVPGEPQLKALWHKKLVYPSIYVLNVRPKKGVNLDIGR